MVLFRQGEALNTQGGYQTVSKTVGNIETWVQTTAGPEVEVFEPWLFESIRRRRAEETQAAFDKALKARERHEAVFAAIGGPKLKD